MRLLDLFCGRWGWSKAFAARGWICVGVDCNEPSEIPDGCRFVNRDILGMTVMDVIDYKPDFICASSPCEEFSVWGMKHFHPDPPYPKTGIAMFDHTRMICSLSGVPFVMENVKAAQKFIGDSKHHCGAFHLWGTAVPPLLPCGISKAKWRPNAEHGRIGKLGNFAAELNLAKPERKALLSTIPPELANCVADYAERLLEQKRLTGTNG